MDKAIIFWFYKEIDVCLNRLEIIKKYNPDLKIFGLYGWDKKNEKEYKNKLWEYFDDFYTIENQDSYRKWAYGDLALQEWFSNKWQYLKWDSVYIVQWDILIFNSLDKIFNNYQKDQVFFSGTKILNKKTEKQWSWTNSEKERPKYLEFKNYLKKNFDYDTNLVCCLPMFEILPRKFFEEYAKLKNLEWWFIEYRKPTYAKIMWFDFYKKDLGVRRFQPNPELLPMNWNSEERSFEFINKELEKKDWRRMFHPYYKIRNI